MMKKNRTQLQLPHGLHSLHDLALHPTSSSCILSTLLVSITTSSMLLFLSSTTSPCRSCSPRRSSLALLQSSQCLRSSSSASLWKLSHLDKSHGNKRRNHFSSLHVCKKQSSKRFHPFVKCNRIWLLNNDLMIEILAQLPIELVPELKRVCKWWCYLAKSLSFCNSHFQKCQKVMSGIFIQGPPLLLAGEEPIGHTAIDYIAIDKEGKYTVHKNKLDFLPEKVVITASFNGLLVCRGLLYRSIDRIQQPIPPDDELAIYVCNPLTREFSTLKPYISKRERCWIGLAFNSLESSSTSFELLVVHYSPMDRSRAWYKFKIFSSKTNEWRIAKDLFYYSHRVNFIRSVFLDGIFYWLTEGGTILAFDLKMEKCHIIELPPPNLLFDTTEGMCLGETDGYIHYVCMSYQELRVWILNSGTDSKSEWRMKFFGHVHYGEIVLVDSGSWNRGDLHDGDYIDNPTATPRCLKDDVIFMRHGYQFCEFDLKTGNLKQICSFGAFRNTAFYNTNVLPYSMSLVPVCNS